MDLVSREAVVDYLAGNHTPLGVELLRKELNIIPAVKVDGDIYGEWIEAVIQGYRKHRCSACYQQAPFNEQGEILDKVCPSCNAIMKIN